MENTLDNKAKFFAQYYGQEVFRLDGLAKLKPKPFETPMDGDHVELKPLSSITDEDLEYIRPLIGYDNTNDGLGLVKRWLTVLWMDHDDVSYFAIADFKPTLRVLKITDYLRSKSYALPYMGLSVDQLVQYGWIKLQED